MMNAIQQKAANDKLEIDEKINELTEFVNQQSQLLTVSVLQFAFAKRQLDIMRDLSNVLGQRTTLD